MVTEHEFSEPLLTIAAVERETGLSKDALRVWERRYGFPKPERDAVGDRRYSGAQVERLRQIKRLIDSGHRAGQVVTMAPEALARLLPGSRPADQTPEASPDIERLLPRLRGGDVAGLRTELRRALLRLGLAQFVVELIAPLTTRVGEAWANEELDVYAEHLYTEAITALMHEAFQGLPAADSAGRPRVLLATLPGESHGLGLLMVQAMMQLEGAPCLPLGTQVPVGQIERAVHAQGSDIVCLSFTACMNSNLMFAGLNDLRARLPREIEIWAGGSAPMLHRRDVPGVRVFDSLGPIRQEIGRWNREARAELRPA